MRQADDLDGGTFDAPQIVIIPAALECRMCGGDMAPSESGLCTFCEFVMSFDAAESADDVSQTVWGAVELGGES